MPSPIGHALVGLTIHTLSARNTHELKSLPRAAGITLLALGPDLDFAVARLVDGYRHQGQIHSVGLALMVGMVGALVAALTGVTSAWRGAWIPTVVWLSHPLLDILSVDTNPPYGPMALWPLSRSHAHSPISLFLDIGRAPDWKTVRHDAIAVAWELCVLLPIVVLIWRRQAKRNAVPDGRSRRHTNMRFSLCERCIIHRWSDAHPSSWLARLWRWHTTWCPGWKAYQRQSKDKTSKKNTTWDAGAWR